MNNPAAKNREDVITDLNDAEFPKKQSRAIVQAVVDTAASLGLATHKDIDALKEDMAALKGDMATHKDIAALKTEIDRLYRFILWGFTAGLSWLSVLLAVVGWLVKAG